MTTPAAKLIASCNGCVATAQAIVLDEIMAALAPFGFKAEELAQAEKNVLANMTSHGVAPHTLDAVAFLLEWRKNTERALA
jgi:hypothetical protein